MGVKIGYICSSLSWGGLEMNQLRNAKWMHDRGHEIVVFAIPNSPIFSQSQQENLTVVSIKRHRKYYDFLAGFQFSKLIREHKITHLFIRDTRDMSIGAAVKFLNPTLKLTYFMEMQLGVSKRNFLHSIRFRALDHWSCPLHWLEKQVHTMTRFDQSKTCVIPSGMELAPFQSNQTQQEARSLLDLPKETIIIGLIGRFDPHKGQLLLLEAMKLSKNANYHICFLGEPTRNEGTTYYDEMLQCIQENRLENRVHIRPFRKDIASFYRAIDLFVMASKAETFGMVTIEAMASGTQTLGSNAGGTPEILEFGDLGLLFEPLNASSLAQNIDAFLTNPTKISSSILREKAKQYDHEKVCQLVEKKILKIEKN